MCCSKVGQGPLIERKTGKYHCDKTKPSAKMRDQGTIALEKPNNGPWKKEIGSRAPMNLHHCGRCKKALTQGCIDRGHVGRCPQCGSLQMCPVKVEKCPLCMEIARAQEAQQKSEKEKEKEAQKIKKEEEQAARDSKKERKPRTKAKYANQKDLPSVPEDPEPGPPGSP